MPSHFHEKVNEVKPDLAGSPTDVIELSTFLGHLGLEGDRRTEPPTP